VRVREIGEDLPFAAHALGRFARRDTAQHLDRDAARERIVGALGEEHGAHAAAADFLDEPVRSEPALDAVRLGDAQGCFAHLARDARARTGIGVGERERLAPKLGVGLDRREPRGALLGHVLEQALEELLQPLPARVAQAASLCFSHARAKRSSRSIVGTESSSTSAISSRLRPRR
jgi:hypothetical protein